MFTVPALLYLKLLPLFGQCLYHFFFIVPNKSRPPHAGGGLPTSPLPALHPFWVGRASVGIFTPYQRESIWPLLMNWCSTGPTHGGSTVDSGFEPGTLRPQSRDLTTRPPRPPLGFGDHTLELSCSHACEYTNQ
ncbi:hypothetical protein AVEN_68470-1 [Araneus ventricosus]|uniref:Uncharacterized protein n=1 Tax=Araneus ventricosus TaxID=182803 RepID=A0A4Y2Q1H5_ARAVE|nr:hypothetical protein AVEN_58954-1 [Araneus ventricosus]GBN56993.1 hypothetical protein AVEN_68470-1 [Araneus ventricosus]